MFRKDFCSRIHFGTRAADVDIMDPGLVEKIVHEVKSQGVFDEFRRDVMADVDTKPAYQNLRQRVEVSVKKFLSEQRWSPEMNKNQLRERLRRHITETRANFLDVGVERIVDQVVNPKIASVFQPRIEEITYKYLGLTPPPPLPPHQYEPTQLMHPVFPPLPMNGSSSALKVETMPTAASLLPTDLEQVSPDSDIATVKSEYKEESSAAAAAEDDMDLETEEKPEDDYESPPFEPLKREVELRDSDMDTSDSPEPPPLNDDTNTSSQPQQQDTETQDTSVSVDTPNAELDSSDKETCISRTHFLEAARAPVGASADAVPEESQLSQVSSDSRISAVSNDFNEDNNTEQTQKSQSSGSGGSGAPTAAAVNISEEAQMPKFSENSSSEAAAGAGENCVNGHNDQSGPQLHFDIKKDEIKFEGTERKNSLLPDASNERTERVFRDCGSGVDKNAAEIENIIGSNSNDQKNSEKAEPNNAFHFCANAELKSVPEVVPVAPTEPNRITPTLPTTLDSSFGSSLEDTNSLQLGASSGGGTEQNTKVDVGAPEKLVALTNNEMKSAKDTSETTTKHTSSSANSSSSRHKKHSKEKRRHSHDKDRHHRSSKGGGGESEKTRSGEKEKEKDSKDRHHSSRSRYKHSSSSSSNAKNASSAQSKALNASASSNNSNKSEKSVVSQSGQQETSRERRRDGGGSADKHRHSSSSSSAVTTAAAANNSKEHSKQQRKTMSAAAPPPPKDDHNESKEKLHWRKSTDSNDEDKGPGSAGKAGSASGGGDNAAGNKSSSSSSNSRTKSKNGNSDVNVKSTQKDAVVVEKAEDNTLASQLPHSSSKVTILNDILQNPATEFIALETTLSTTQANHVQIVSSSSTTHSECITAASQPPLDLGLHFFEEDSTQFLARLRLLDNAMDRYRKVINTLRFDTMPPPLEDEEHEEFELEKQKKNGSQLGAKMYSSVVTGGTQATLLVDCVRYDSAEFDGACSSSEQAEREASAPFSPKRFKRNGGSSKPSPTPSDTSINSKENEAFDKNTVDPASTRKTAAVATAACAPRSSLNAVQKQRYSSEDLYKPRPILSQRSRRRGVDSVI